MATPTPNPNSEKRSKESAGWITLPNEGPTEDPPELIGDHGPEGEELWAFWWSSPMALMWSRHDCRTLERLLVLSLRFGDDSGATAAELSEVRQLEDRFGLNPKSRRQLYWRIAGVDAPSMEASDLHRPATGVDLPAAGGDDDPRRLRAV